KMKELITSDKDIYENMTIDLHNQGLILKRKYNLLLYSYQVLLYGFVISVILFLAMLMMGRFG
ncbi:MAG TPA: Pycsar system effector family protein, partial [Saprospiraceae bacterium]|nr:Pycsar system effector family protein [Saprospiraceae bacterium]